MKSLIIYTGQCFTPISAKCNTGDEKGNNVFNAKWNNVMQNVMEVITWSQSPKSELHSKNAHDMCIKASYWWGWTGVTGRGLSLKNKTFWGVRTAGPFLCFGKQGLICNKKYFKFPRASEKQVRLYFWKKPWCIHKKLVEDFFMVGKGANYSEKQVRTNEIITPIHYLLSSERNNNFHLLALIVPL